MHLGQQLDEAVADMVEHGATEQIFSNPVKQQTEDYITGRFG